MSLDLLLSSVSQGMMWSILAMGVYISFRLLDSPDLSAEGAFPLGAAVVAKLLLQGVSPIVALAVAFLAGTLAGLLTGFMTTQMKIPVLLSGILTMTALYSINLRLMGKANIPLIGQKTLITFLEDRGLQTDMACLLLAVLVVTLVILLLVLFMRTEYGLTLRATGDNPVMSEANGIKTDQLKLVGFMLSNGLIALSGGLLAQSNGFVDIAMGTGTIVIGLAAVIIGEVLLKKAGIPVRLISIVIGAIIYRLVIDLIMQQSLIPILSSDIKILSALALAIILWGPHAGKKAEE
ncbi:ABC transporter permease [Atopobacter sp. AH10]|uniref:ABC transporter permease n=1 Tax=Atopobacter sp. AH10 TaxID=2315861 RepID=UPI000EF1838D|nr:ABC transporter permease [Atopobacter sp. AH10]RLK64167.1 ABC transporter permease [Atopobacter sp. AH10]